VPGERQAQGELYNPGDVPVSSLAAVFDVEQLAGISALTIDFPAVIPAGARLPFNVTVLVPGPFVGLYFPVKITSPQIEAVYAYISVIVKPLEPRLIVNPRAIGGQVARGLQRLVEIEVQNVGAAESGPLNVLLPNDDALSLASPATIATLHPTNKTLVLVWLRPAAGAKLGRKYGSLAVSGPKIGVSVSYDFYVVSSARTSLTVAVEDELTFFGVDKPRVAGATVDIVSGDGSVSLRQITPLNGTVVFANIPEAFYKLRVQAKGHDGVSSTIEVRRDFLQGTLASRLNTPLHVLPLVKLWQAGIHLRCRSG